MGDHLKPHGPIIVANQSKVTIFFYKVLLEITFSCARLLLQIQFHIT
jgi:hypothetical protein